MIKSGENTILLTSLLLGSAVSMLGSGFDYADTSFGLASMVDLLSAAATMACLTSIMLNIYLVQIMTGVGDANVHLWVLANHTYLFSCHLFSVIAIYLFMFGVLAFGLLTSLTPYALLVVWGFFFVSLGCLVGVLGSSSAFCAAHSGMLADVSVLSEDMLLRLRSADDATQILADRALVNEGDREAMYALYRKLGLALSEVEV